MLLYKNTERSLLPSLLFYPVLGCIALASLGKKGQQLLFCCVAAIKALKHKIFVDLGNIGKIIGVEMMPRSISYYEELIKTLKDPLEAAPYIEVVLEEGDPKMLRKALKNIIEAQGGVDKLLERVKQCYEKLVQMLEEKGEVDFYCLSALLDALGLQLAVTVKSM